MRIRLGGWWIVVGLVAFALLFRGCWQRCDDGGGHDSDAASPLLDAWATGEPNPGHHSDRAFALPGYAVPRAALASASIVAQGGAKGAPRSIAGGDARLIGSPVFVRHAVIRDPVIVDTTTTTRPDTWRGSGVWQLVGVELVLADTVLLDQVIVHAPDVVVPAGFSIDRTGAGECASDADCGACEHCEATQQCGPAGLGPDVLARLAEVAVYCPPVDGAGRVPAAPGGPTPGPGSPPGEGCDDGPVIPLDCPLQCVPIPDRLCADTGDSPDGGPAETCRPLFERDRVCDPTHCDPTEDGWLAAYGGWLNRPGAGWPGVVGNRVPLRPIDCWRMALSPDHVPPECRESFDPWPDAWEARPGRELLPDTPIPWFAARTLLCAEPDIACHGDLVCAVGRTSAMHAAPSCVSCDASGRCDRLYVDPYADDGATVGEAECEGDDCPDDSVEDSEVDSEGDSEDDEPTSEVGGSGWARWIDAPEDGRLLFRGRFNEAGLGHGQETTCERLSDGYTGRCTIVDIDRELAPDDPEILEVFDDIRRGLDRSLHLGPGLGEEGAGHGGGAQDLTADRDVDGADEYGGLDQLGKKPRPNATPNVGDGDPSNSTSATTGGDPVVLASGEWVHRTTDLALPPAHAGAIVFSRTYRSGGYFAGHLGRNWEHVFEQRLIPVRGPVSDPALPQWCNYSSPVPNCLLHYRGDGGSDVYLYDPATGTYVPEGGAFSVVTTAPAPVPERTRPPAGVLRLGSRRLDLDARVPDAEELAQRLAPAPAIGSEVVYRLRAPDGTITVFDADGQLRVVRDAVGNETRYLRDSRGRLAYVVDDLGHWLRFDYGLWDLLEGVEDDLGRRVRFHYELGVPHLPREIEEADVSREQYSRGPAALTLAQAGDLRAPGTDLARGPGYDTAWLPFRDSRRPVGELRRSVARLVRVDILPVADGAAARVGLAGGAQPLHYRYAYSDVPDDPAFREAMVHRVKETLGDQGDGCATTQPGRVQTETVALYQRLTGRLVRIERRRTNAEAMVGSAVRCDGRECWITLIETRYDWRLAEPTLGRVVAQRSGTDASLLTDDPGEPARDTGVDEFADPFWTRLPLTSFRYAVDRDGLERIPASLATAAARRGIDVASGGCAASARKHPRFANDLLRLAVRRPRALPDFLPVDGYRSRRVEASRKICAVATTVDRVGVTTHVGLNMMGLAVLTAVETGGEPWVTETRYNADGHVVARSTPDGVWITRRYDDEANENGYADPASWSRVIEWRETPGRPSIPNGVRREELILRTAERSTSAAYEPLSGQIIRHTDLRGEATDVAFAFQESAGAFRAAERRLSAFGIDPRVLSRIVPVLDADVNGDGRTADARPLPVRTLLPRHRTGDGDTARREERVVYDGFGNPIQREDSAGLRVERAYAAAEPASAVAELCDAELDRCNAAWLPPIARDGAGGGHLLEVTDIVDQTPSAARVAGAARVIRTTTAWHYGPHGRPDRVTLPSGGATVFRYDGHGRLHSVVQPDGMSTKWVADGAGAVVRVKRSAADGAQVRRLFRDAEGNVIAQCEELEPNGCEAPLVELVRRRREHDRRALLWTYHLDGEGRPQLVTSPERRVVERRYDPMGRINRTRVYREGSATVLLDERAIVDSHARIVGSKRVDPATGEAIVRVAAVDGYGDVVAELSPFGTVSTVVLDVDGALLAQRVVDSEGRLLGHRMWKRGPGGFLASRTDGYVPNPTWPIVHYTVTSFDYDAAGRAVRISRPDGTWEERAYASDGHLAAETNSTGESIAIARDPGSRTVWQRFQVDGDEAFAVEQRLTHDWAGRLLEVRTDRTGTAPAITRVRYDGLGRPAVERDEAGRETRFHYDPASRLVEVDLPGAGTVRFERDGDGLPVEEHDAAGGVTRRSYDALGRAVVVEAPGATSAELRSERTYDGLGRLERVRSGGVSYSRHYVRGTLQPRRIAVPGATIDFSYDASGWIAGATRSEGGAVVRTVYTRDGRGQVTSERTRIVAGAVQRELRARWERDELGRVTAIVSPSGYRAEWEWELGRRKQVRLGADDSVFVEEAWTGGRVTTRTWPGGATTELQVDTAGRAQSLRFSRAGTALANAIVGYEADDRVRWVWRQVGGATASSIAPRYDAAGRLDGWTEGAGGAPPEPDRAPDIAGTRVKLERTPLGTLTGELRDGAESWSVELPDGARAPNRVAVDGDTYDVSWDAQGRLSQRGDLSVTWTGDGLLREVARAGVPVERRIYDAFGRAVVLVRSEGELVRAWDGSQVLEESSRCGTRSSWTGGVGNPPLGYHLQWDEECARLRNESPALLDASAEAAGNYIIVYDLHDNAMALIDERGDVVERYSHGPYGGRQMVRVSGDVCTASVTGSCPSAHGNPIGFAGGRLTPMGWYEHGARHFDPVLRSFSSPDPLGTLDSHDTRLYARGDPLNFIDSSGLRATPPNNLPIRPPDWLTADEPDPNVPHGELYIPGPVTTYRGRFAEDKRELATFARMYYLMPWLRPPTYEEYIEELVVNIVRGGRMSPLDGLHVVLGVLGEVPGLELVVDPVDAALFTAEGRYAEAGLTMLPATAIVGVRRFRGALPRRNPRRLGVGDETYIARPELIGDHVHHPRFPSRGRARLIDADDHGFVFADMQFRQVRYSRDGVPDFTDYMPTQYSRARATQVVDVTGHYGTDAGRANRAAGFTATPQGYTWHHLTDVDADCVGTMILVATDVHRTFQHRGGAAIARRQGCR